MGAMAEAVTNAMRNHPIPKDRTCPSRPIITPPGSPNTAATSNGRDMSKLAALLLMP